MKIKKIIVTSVLSVLFLAASVFAFSETDAKNSCPLKKAAQATEIDYEKTNVVFAKGDSCCQPGAACCTGGACCKNKRN